MASFFARSLPGLKVGAILEGSASQYALVFAKGNGPLRDAVNGALRELKSDGTYGALFTRWFGGLPAVQSGSAGVAKSPEEGGLYPTTARIWRGRTRASDLPEYRDYLRGTGVRDLRATEGNIGVQVLARIEGDIADFMVVSWWDSYAAIRRFAGPDAERAVYYPEDGRYLLSIEPRVDHYEVLVSEPGARAAFSAPPMTVRM